MHTDLTVYHVCSFCREFQLPTKLCGQCKTSRYCSSECQKKHWPVHKSECKERVQMFANLNSYAQENRHIGNQLRKSLGKIIFGGKFPACYFSGFLDEAASRKLNVLVFFHGPFDASTETYEELMQKLCYKEDKRFDIQVVSRETLLQRKIIRGPIRIDCQFILSIAVNLGTNNDEQYNVSFFLAI